jgi:predicted amino acid dehydrogenase
MGDLHFFERLVETAELIARHADYPGKRLVVHQCREEVEDLARAGRITATQGEALRGILLEACYQTA